jgi:dihydrofolate synthase / folylpolyglutamate synthase
VVAHDKPPGAEAALRGEARRRGAPLTLADAGYAGAIALPGPHQQANAALAAAAVRLLAPGGLVVPEDAIARGIATARWPGRLETLSDVLLDGAHNPDGAVALSAALPALHPGRPVELVFGVLADKDHARMVRTLGPVVRALHLVAPRSPRARPPSTYLALAAREVARVDEHASVEDAIACARRAAADGALVCVAGSLYLVGEARALLAGAAGPEPG